MLNSVKCSPYFLSAPSLQHFTNLCLPESLPTAISSLNQFSWTNCRSSCFWLHILFFIWTRCSSANWSMPWVFGFLPSLLYSPVLQGHSDALPRASTETWQSKHLCLFHFLLPQTPSLFQLLHSLMSGTDRKMSSLFLTLLVEGEGAAILCRAEEPAVGGCHF